MALTRKALLYLSAAYIFIGLALVLREPSLTIFAIPIALTFLYASLSSPIGTPDLRVRRRLNPLRSFGAENITVTVEVLNNLNKNLDQLRLEDSVPGSLQIESGVNSFSLSLKPYEQREQIYEISAPKRGRYILGPLKAFASDLMDFRRYSVTVPSENVVMILPRVEGLSQVELAARRIGPWPGTIPSKSVGPGSDFFELRLYSPGDELRRINWKASAKQRQLVTNEFETERVTDVFVVLDSSEAVLSGLFSFDAEEFQVSLTASLCSQLLLQGNRVGLSIYGAERTWLPLSFGKRQLLKILNSLTIARAGKAIVPIDFAVETIVKAVLPARSVIAFISPVLDDGTVDVIRKVAAAGYSVLCLTPATEQPSTDESRSKLLAWKLLAVQRRVNLKRVLSVARCVEVSPKTSISVLSRRGILRKRA